MKQALFLVFFLFMFRFIAYSQNGSNRTERPNIILIVSDDMGFSDIGCFGGEIETPHIDELGMSGIRYTQFYNMDHCAPSRAALLTGLYPHQTGLGWMPDKDFHLPGYRGELNKECVTIAEALKNGGYSTMISGKWHLTHNIREGGAMHNWPLQRGFDRFYGILTGAGNYYDPASLTRDNTLITPKNDSEYQPESYYFTDAITDNALRFIKERPKERPFFLYLTYTTAHWPMQAPESEIAKYKGKYDIGWDSLRLRRFRREISLGVIDSSTTLSPLDTKPWIEEEDKMYMARRMETYAAMVTIMDNGIGKIIDNLKKEGIFDNTVIIYLQDNGGNAESVGYGKGVNGENGTVAANPEKLRPLGKDEIQYTVVPAITHNGAIAKVGKRVMAGPEDTYLAYLKPWGNLSNTPFKKYKNFTYEGGISTPLIIHWTNGIKSNNGEICREVGHEIDILPTLLEIAGINYPKNYGGNKITPVAGTSLVPTFKHVSLEPRAVFWEHQANRAVRMGKWKLISPGILHGNYGNWHTYTSLPWELYDMENDRSEMRDLSGQHPELVNKMSDLWDKWAWKSNVFPMPWQESSPNEKSFYLSTPWEFSGF